MARTFSLFALFTMVGCAAPFTAVRPESRAGAIVVSYCGSSSYRAETVIAVMDGPPSGETGSTSGPPREATLCVQLANGGARAVLVNRNFVRLRGRSESYGITADRDDDHFMVPGGTTRKFKMTFQYGSTLLSGEDAELRFEDALSVDGRPIALPSLVLRRR
jgi:hypothetical protein